MSRRYHSDSVNSSRQLAALQISRSASIRQGARLWAKRMFGPATKGRWVWRTGRGGVAVQPAPEPGDFAAAKRAADFQPAGPVASQRPLQGVLAVARPAPVGAGTARIKRIVVILRA